MQYSIKQAISKASDKLNEIGIKYPQLEARILLQYAINKPHEYLLVNSDQQLNSLEIDAFEKALDRRLKHEPIAYITGIKEFYSRDFTVNKHVLIPRADTEILVDVVLQCPSQHSQCHSRVGGNPEKKQMDSVVKPRNDNFHILELGTGSGCIAISLLLETPNAQVTATDISLNAIEIAKSNAVKHGVMDRLQIIHSDWFESLEKQKFDLIISNPPYISIEEKSEMALEAINHEPHLALFAEEDGLQAYRIIAENAKRFLKPNGKIILEIGFNQADKVSQIFSNYGYVVDNIHQDLQSHNRVIEISLIQLNRSYARRIGKSLSGVQQNLLDNELPKYLFSKEKLANEKREIYLEIGFGMGEHFINQAKMNPEALFIGVEVYLNGVANVLKLAHKQNIKNFLLFPNNLDFVLHDLPDNSLDGIYILFPDPWIKNRQKKKRILGKERLKILQPKLKDKGILIFASDIENYFDEAVELIKQNSDFQILNEGDYLTPHENYITTKYHQKAINEGRTAKFITAFYAV